MAEMSVIFGGLQTQMRETDMACNLQLHYGNEVYINIEFTTNGIFSEINLVGCLDGWKTSSTIVIRPGFETMTSHKALTQPLVNSPTFYSCDHKGGLSKQILKIKYDVISAYIWFCG